MVAIHYTKLSNTKPIADMAGAELLRNMLAEGIDRTYLLK